MNQGITKKRKLVEQSGRKGAPRVAARALGWTQRRKDLVQDKREMLNGQIDLLDQAVVEIAEKNEKARLLMTQPGVGPITSLAFVLTWETSLVFSAASKWRVTWG